MLTRAECDEIRKTLSSAKNPLFIFDDDPDGLAAFLLLYRWLREGSWFVLKAQPRVTKELIGKVREREADLVVILDIAKVDQEFIDGVGVPVLWVDHHGVEERENVLYYNPLVRENKYIPTSRLLWDVVEQDDWIALVGCVYDHFWPKELGNKIASAFPSLLEKGIVDVSVARFGQEFGKLVRIFSYAVKGSTTETRRAVNALTKVKSPLEILEQSTDEGRWAWKQYSRIQEEYDAILAELLKKSPDRGVFLADYSPPRHSVTKELSDELIYRFPDQVVIVAREKGGQYKCSLRAREPTPLRDMVLEAVGQVRGRAGGHPQACGAVIEADDFPRFVELIKASLTSRKKALGI